MCIGILFEPALFTSPLFSCVQKIEGLLELADLLTTVESKTIRDFFNGMQIHAFWSL